MMGAFICKKCGTYNVSGGGCGACGFEGIDTVFTSGITDAIEITSNNLTLLQSQIDQLREDVNVLQFRILNIKEHE